MTYDVFTYNGEADILDIRLNMLSPYVDKFIICEATETFSGKPKPLYYAAQKNRFKKFKDQIKYHVIRPPYEKRIVAMADESPYVTRESHNWHREFCQKESIKEALKDLKDDDIVCIGDVDEIWDTNQQYAVPQKVKLRVYTYYLNNRSTEEFWGTLITKYETIRIESCLNELRNNILLRGSDYGGWHFTSMGGYKELKRKLESSYTKDNYYNEWVESNLEQNMAQNKDFLGRPFQFKKNESEWPQYLKDNKEKYKHLCL